MITKKDPYSRKFSTVFGTVSPKRPRTIRPPSPPSISLGIDIDTERYVFDQPSKELKILSITETISYSPHRRRPSSLQFHWRCESKIYG